MTALQSTLTGHGFGMTASTIYSGYAVAEITLDEQVSLMGYGFRAPGYDAVHEPLMMRGLALELGEGPVAVLLSLDLCVIPRELARRFREEIAEELETEVSRVMLVTTHTHSGPYPEETWMLESVLPQAKDVAKRAAGLTYPVSLWTREAPCGLGYNRRVKDADGRIQHCWNPQEYPDLIPELSPDPTCSLLEFRQVNGSRRTLIWNLGIHPVVLGKTCRVLSGDYPGVANRLLQEKQIDPLFVMGASGEVHPWVATQEDPDQASAMGEAAAAFVRILSQGGRPVGWAEGDALQSVAESVAFGENELDLCVWKLGELYIVGVPVELFAELGAAIREQLKAPVILATLTNGWHQYWPTEQAHYEGGYEIDAEPEGFRVGDGERLLAEVLRLAKSLS